MVFPVSSSLSPSLCFLIPFYLSLIFYQGVHFKWSHFIRRPVYFPFKCIAAFVRVSASLVKTAIKIAGKKKSRYLINSQVFRHLLYSSYSFIYYPGVSKYACAQEDQRYWVRMNAEDVMNLSPLCRLSSNGQTFVLKENLVHHFLIFFIFMCCWPCILVIFDYVFQLNALLVYYIFSYSSTCFGPYCAHHQKGLLYIHSICSLYVTLLRWPFSAQVVRGHNMARNM